MKTTIFYDKQFGLSLNLWNGGNEQNFNDLVEKLPLSKKFYWNNENSDLKTVTPITKKRKPKTIFLTKKVFILNYFHFFFKYAKLYFKKSKIANTVSSNIKFKIREVMLIQPVMFGIIGEL